MFTHRDVWNAIDALAARKGLSLSGLAKSAGLDATAFNPSKRKSATGKPRWPSTESVAKVLSASGTSIETFVELMFSGVRRASGRTIPLIGLAEAGDRGYFDDGGFPVGSGWEAVTFPNIDDENAYALEVSGDSMLPLYRDGDVLIVAPNAGLRRGDRVVVKTTGGEVMVKQLARHTAQQVELASLNPAYPNRTLLLSEVAWLARILWASQ